MRLKIQSLVSYLLEDKEMEAKVGTAPTLIPYHGISLLLTYKALVVKVGLEPTRSCVQSAVPFQLGYLTIW